MPRNAPIEIGGTTVAPGTRHSLEIPVARLPTDTYLSLPVQVVHGRHPGPKLWLNGAIHGDELNGVEIIRQVIKLMRPRDLHGTVIAVPIVNVFGFVSESRYLPDRRDLNRAFPGSPRGSLAAQLAHLFVTEVVQRCDHGIDFHTGSDHRTNLPQVRCDLTDPEVERLAHAFAAPVTVHASYRDGSLRTVCSSLGIPLLVYEGGEAHRFNENAIRAGVDGTLRVLIELGMVSANGQPPPPTPTVIVHHTRWERARRGGIARIDVYPGQRVEQGDELGVVGDALGQSATPVRATISGIVLGYTRNPLVNRGDALVHIADLSPSARGGPARPPT
ncbi:MAG: succinylglutamate desuccinylase/aspartoacylase family protein [Acidimicrobiales bacterium]